jgi:serine/threonine protein kinase
MPDWKPAEKLKRTKLNLFVSGPLPEPPAVSVEPDLEMEMAAELDSPAPAPAPEIPIAAVQESDSPQQEMAPCQEQVLSFPDLGARYDVLELIGTGGMGTVWKVFDKQLGETFAIKVLNPDLIADATAVKRFEKEANLASDLTHANIAAIFGPGADSQGRPFIIMRYVDGESLADILAAEGKLSEERALNIFSQVCDALAHSHMKGIVHRDIKPSNIIISKTESGADMVHVVDFGIARCVYDEVTKTQALTKAVDIFGSPRYMSPEQFLGQEVTGQSDIYSLGCVLYEMLTGTPPFTEENPVKLILQQIGEPADFSKIPVKFHLLLGQCLEKSPAARAPDVGYIQRTLSAMDSAVPLNGQSLALLHGILAVILVMVASIPPMSGVTPIACGILAFIWLYVAVLNVSNAGHSLQYRLLELNLLLAFIANFSLSLAQFFHLDSLLAPVLALTNLWLIMRNKGVEIYSSFISNFFVCLVNWAQVYNSRVLAGALLRSINFLMMFCSIGVSFLIIPPVMDLVCLWDLKTQQMIRSIFELISVCLFGCTMLIFLRLLYDRLLCIRSANQSLARSLKIQSALVLGFAIITFGLIETVGRNGFYQFKRQQGNYLISSGNLQRLRLEAIDYKDSPLSNRAKLIAGREIFAQDKNYRIASELCDQIIDSKLEKDPLTLAGAYSLRSRVRYVTENNVLARSDWDKAFELVHVARISKSESIESTVYSWLGVNKPSLEREAIRLAKLAVDNKDIARCEKSLKLFREIVLPEVYFKMMEVEIDAIRNHKPPPNLPPDFWG